MPSTVKFASTLEARPKTSVSIYSVKFIVYIEEITYYLLRKNDSLAIFWGKIANFVFPLSSVHQCQSVHVQLL